MRPSSSSESSLAAVRWAAPRARAGRTRRGRRGLGRTLMLLATAWLLAAAPAAPAAGKARVRYVTSNGVRYLYLADVADLFGMRYEAGSRSFALRSRWSCLTFTVNETQAVINGTRVHLSDAPWLSKGQAVLADVDFRLLLRPILNPNSLQRGNVRRVLIDPGHGGRDPGTQGKRHKEKDVVLQVARRLEKELRGMGFEVALTRSRDTELSLAARTQKAAAWKADIMVSLHCNAASPSVRGIEVFRMTPQGARSTYSLQRTSGTCRNSPWEADNARLAYEVQRALVAGTDAVDRGTKSARFAVLRDSPCPAVLVEMGFMSCPTEDARLGTAAYQDRLAKSVALGIQRYDASLPPR